MRRVKSLLCLFWVSAMLVNSVAAQDRSPIDELIDRAQQALDNLQYARAESIARSLLDMGDRATRSQRITGLQLLAAALYPEEQAAQQPDSAQRYLQELVRLTPDAEIPRNVSWVGLDSLLTSARRTTFAVWADPQHRNALVGPEAELRIDVTASHTARFQLSAAPTSAAPSEVGRVMNLASAGPGREGALVVRVLANGVPVLPRGEYTLRISGVDTLSDERVELTFHATVDVPPLEIQGVPAALDSSLLLPERAPRRTVKNVLLGVGLGAATALAATRFAGSDAVGSSSSGNRAYVVGVGMTVGALIGAFVNRGAPLPANVEHNDQVRQAFDERLRQLRAENERRRTDYRATITIEGGAR